jgi:hypothetical protein
MVTFKPQGRLGNFLFEFATAYAYSLKHRLDFSMPSTTNDPKWNPIYFPELINPNYNTNLESVIITEQNYFKFDPLPFEESWRNKNIIFEGYFQNWQYFDEYRNEILDYLKTPSSFTVKLVAVHQRRGDYITLREKHPEVTDQWYRDQMALFPNCSFVFFSDDIEYCKNTFGHLNNYYSEGKTELEDLFYMSRCEHQICSASTFSWWSAYLNRNPDKRVIMPKQWMTPAHSNQWTEEIVYKNWERR